MADTDVDFDLLIKAGGPVRSFKAGDVIFREGDPAVELFVVKSGTVEIRIRDRFIGTLGERSIFRHCRAVEVYRVTAVVARTCFTNTRCQSLLTLLRSWADHRRVAALCQPGEPIVVHVPRAEGRQAATL